MDTQLTGPGDAGRYVAMPAFYEIRYSDGRVEETFGIRGLYYEFPNGESLDVHTEIAWCKKCDTFADVEHLKTIPEIDQEIADLNDPTSDLYRMFFDSPAGAQGQFLQSQLAEAIRRKSFLERRNSPPKCVHCGSVELIHTPCGTEIKHPNQDLTFVMECTGMCSTDFMNWYFTPEGDRIPRDSKPSYWHHPGLDRDITNG